MAVYAAHLTRTLQGTPSVFQVAAQEALGATVKPALRKLIEYLSAVYPNKCGWCERWYDELYLLFDLCLQYHYLKHYAASFSETFYGLLRAPLTASEFASPGQRLPEALERGSLLLLVVVPYLRDKVEKVIDRWREENEDGRLGQSGAASLRRAAIHIHTTSHMVYHLSQLVQLARYSRGTARAPSPALALLGLRLTHAPARDGEDSWGDWGRSIISGDFGNAMVTFPMLGQLVLRGAEYSAFVIQFLRWWESRAAADCTASLPQPPPPTRDEKCLRYKNRCPLCIQIWKIPTVLPVSGYIFCYVCISRHIRSRGSCPVTGTPATERELVRLYIE